MCKISDNNVILYNYHMPQNLIIIDNSIIGLAWGVK